MKIAFATLYDSRDVRRGSGTFYYMSREIERQGHVVHRIGPLSGAVPLITRLIRAVHVRIGRRYQTYLDPFVARMRGREVSRALIALDYDCLLTNDFAIAGYTATAKPVVLYTDVMIPRDYHAGSIPPHSRIANLSRVGVWLYQHTIRRGLERSALCIFPEAWAAREAQRYCPIASKTRVIPFGANLEDPGPEVAAGRRLAWGAARQRIDLLFVGKDWARKGGDIAVQTTLILRERGIDAVLHIAGAVPPETANPDAIKVYGLLDKTTPSGMETLDRLFRTCDVLILPSSGEGFVIVALEAAAYGLPVLAYDIVGVNSAVRDGETGQLVTWGAPAMAFADAVAAWLADPLQYQRLVTGARRYYEDTVNWKVVGRRLIMEVEAHTKG